MKSGKGGGGINGTRVAAALMIAVAAASALRLLGGYLPFERIWGIDYLSWYGLPWDVCWSLLPLFTAMLLLRTRSIDAQDGSSRAVGSFAWIIFIVSAALALVAPVRTFFYGDGGLLVPQMHRLAAGEELDYNLLFNLKSSPLAGAAVYAIARGLPALFNLLSLPLPGSALYPFQALSVIVSLLLALFFLRRREGHEGITPEALLIAGTPGALFLLGYVEFYLPVYVATGIFLILAERHMRGLAGIRAPAACLLIAIASHYYALAFLPAFVYAFAHRRGALPAWAKSTRRLALVSAGVFAAAAALYFISGFAAGDSRIVMPMLPPETPAGVQWYTLLSRYHLLDLVNTALFLSPISVFAVAAILAVRRSTARSPEFRFYLTAAAPFFIFLFFANTSLGLARDWDLAAVWALPMGFLGLTAVRTAAGARSRSAGLAYAAASFVFTLPWITLHLDSEAAAARFERILPIDEGHMYRDYALSGYEALRKYYQNKGDQNKDIELSMKKIEILDYPSNYSLLLAKTASLHSVDAARSSTIRRWMLARLSNRASALKKASAERDYAISRAQIDSLAEAIAFSAFAQHQYRLIENDVNSVAAITGAGQPYPSISALEAWERRDFASAARLLEKSMDGGFREPRLFLLLGNARAILGDFGASLAALEEGVRLYPREPMLLYTLGSYIASSGKDPGAAATLLQAAIANGLSGDREREARSALQRLAGGSE